MCATCVDDTLHAGSDKYSDYCKRIEKLFIFDQKERDKIQCPGTEAKTKETMFDIHQERYTSTLKKLAQKSSYADFRTLCT